MGEEVEPSAETSRGTPADALFDKVEFGIAADLFVPDGLTGLVRRLFEARMLKRASLPAVRGASIRERIEFSVPGRFVGVPPSLAGTLALVQIADGVVRVRDDTVLVANGMRLLRARHPARWPCRRDGDDNLIGPWSEDWQRLLGSQANLLAEAVGSFLDRLHSAAQPVGLGSGRVRIRACELCRDFAYTDAVATVARLAKLPAGTQRATQREYGGWAEEVDGNALAVFRDDGRKRGSIKHKAYTKGGLIRTELVLSSRDALVRLLGGRSSALDLPPADIVDTLPPLLVRIAAAAVPHLDGLRDELDAVPPAPANRLDLLGALGPLLRVAFPPATSTGRTFDAETSERARVALGALLTLRRFDARGLGSSNGVRKALDEMAVGEAAVLERGGPRGTLFLVRASYVEPATSLAGWLSGGAG